MSLLSTGDAHASVADDRLNQLPRRIAGVLDSAGYIVLSLAFGTELFSTLIEVIGRKLGHVVAWQPEIEQLGLAVLAFIGGAVAYSQGYQVALSFLSDRLKPSNRGRVADAMDAVVIVTGVSAAVLSESLLVSGWGHYSAILGWPETFFVLPFTVGMLLLAVYGILNLWSRFARRTVAAAGAVIVVTILLVIAWGTSTALPTDATLWVAVALLAILMTLGLPLGVALIIAPLAAMVATNATDPIVVPVTMTDAANNQLFLAVPFFVFAGLILANAGLSLRLAELIGAILGPVRGAFYLVILVSMFVFSGLSGSKFADMAAVGTPMGNMLDRYGHRRDEAAAVLSAAAVMGETIPPSIAMLILGSITTISIASLFLGGLIPAVVLGITLMAYVYYRAGRTEQPRVDKPARLWRSAVEAVPALLLPVILIGGIVGGIATPTEVSSFAVAYGVAVALVVYRVGMRSLWQSLKSALATSGWILFLLAGASVLSWIFTYDQVPQGVAAFATDLGSAWLFMLVSIVILIVFGLLLEGAAAIIVLAPILLPAAQSLGINPIQYGIVLIIAMGLGAHLPPMGVGLYVASSVMRTPVEQVFRPMTLYAMVLFVGLVVVALVPALTLAIPYALGFH